MAKTLHLPYVSTTFVKTVPLCASTAFVAKTLPLPCVSTAFMANTLPLPCASIAFVTIIAFVAETQGSVSATKAVETIAFVAETLPLPCVFHCLRG